ncbi:SWIM zinc finger family protein [Effusibacillus pohliae]|uniref:SWIM zinc finger family protein n=1 Tax=Effusibacillus pohliae TaxID=232270 RepID=UPI00036475BD|nr:SWIM zinc finger family protein [Effusibacillus pohliae]
MFRLSMEDLTNRIRPYFRDTILKRGWDYYLADSVEDLEMEGKAVIKATVYGSEPYQVRIHLDAFPSSTCSCPYGDYCKHMAAVLFEACAAAGLTPRQFLSPKRKRAGGADQADTDATAIQAEAEIAAAAVEAAASAAAGTAPSPVPKTAGRRRITAPQETGSVAEWHSYFEKQFGKHPFYGAHFLETITLQIRDHLFPFAQSWNPTIRCLYQLHVNLFVLKLCSQFYQKYENPYAYYSDHSAYYREQSVRCIEEIIRLINQPDVVEVRRLYSRHLVETAHFLAEHAFPGKQTPINWSFVYRFLWWSWLNVSEWVHAERLRLQAELKKPGLQPIRKDALVTALVHFEIMAGNDQQAMKMADEQLSVKDPGSFMGYLHTFFDLQEWDRMVAWLRWMKPLVKHAGQPYMSWYLQYWREVGKQIETEAEWVETALYLLPDSYSYYADYLMERKRYREWVDLNLLCRLSPLQADPTDLKRVEAHDPALVLPLYHQAIDRFIAEKNRDSYKQAVKLLKKLKQHYRRLKQEQRWNKYIAFLTKQYARYRALQEELKKGNIIG